MDQVKLYKEVAVLPGVLEPNALYLVRVGGGFDLYAVDSTGTLAFTQNFEPVAPKEPVATHDAQGRMTRIDYSNGSFKVFSYSGYKLTQSDYTSNGVTTRRTYQYNADGTFRTYTETTL